jgi:hypothetical protein
MTFFVFHAEGMAGIGRRVWDAGALRSDAEGAGEEFLSADWGRFSQIGEEAGSVVALFGAVLDPAFQFVGVVGGLAGRKTGI